MKETFDSCDLKEREIAPPPCRLGGEGWKLHPPKRDWQQQHMVGRVFMVGERVGCAMAGRGHTLRKNVKK